MEAAFGRLHNSGAGALGARPTVVESIVVDGEIDGSIYGTIYPSIYGSENGARNNNPSGRIINSSGRIIEGPLVQLAQIAKVAAEHGLMVPLGTAPTVGLGLHLARSLGIVK